MLVFRLAIMLHARESLKDNTHNKPIIQEANKIQKEQ